MAPAMIILRISFAEILRESSENHDEKER